MSVSNLMGALASSLAASCFIVGFIIYFTLLSGSAYPVLTGDRREQVEFMLANYDFLQVWYLIIYLLFGFCLVVLIPVLHQQLSKRWSLLVDSASIFGLIWAGLVIASGLIITTGMTQVHTLFSQAEGQAMTLWLVSYALLDALGGGNEIVGGLWVLLISFAGVKEGVLPIWLCVSGFISGVAGILTMIPAFHIMAVIFGFGSILWFGGVSMALLNKPAASPAR